MIYAASLREFGRRNEASAAEIYGELTATVQLVRSIETLRLSGASLRDHNGLQRREQPLEKIQENRDLDRDVPGP